MAATVHPYRPGPHRQLLLQNRPNRRVGDFLVLTILALRHLLFVGLFLAITLLVSSFLVLIALIRLVFAVTILVVLLTITHFFGEFQEPQQILHDTAELDLIIRPFVQAFERIASPLFNDRLPDVDQCLRRRRRSLAG